MKEKDKVSDEIADYIYGKLKENYFPRYYIHRVKQSKSVETIVKDIYQFYSQKHDFFLIEYFPYVKLIKQKSNYHFHFLAIKKDYHV